MMTEQQAQYQAKTLNGTYEFPEVQKINMKGAIVIGKDDKPVMLKPKGKRTAKVGSHITNGQTRWQVHITCQDMSFTPYTIS